jgi:hypothetical protein
LRVTLAGKSTSWRSKSKLILAHDLDPDGFFPKSSADRAAGRADVTGTGVLDQVASLMSYGLSVDLLAELLPIGSGDYSNHDAARAAPNGGAHRERTGRRAVPI